jgi:hypothetical protein
MKNQEFQLEELENAAVKKSNNAKRAAVAAGVFAAGGAAGGVAAAVVSNSPEQEESLTEEDLDAAIKAGTSQETSSDNSGGEKVAPRAEPPVEPRVEPEAEVVYDKTTHVYVDDELYATSVTGTVDGHNFEMVDFDDDNKADVVAIDENDDGLYQDNEVHATYGYGPSMDVPATKHEDVLLSSEDLGLNPIEPSYPEPGESWTEGDEDILQDKEGAGTEEEIKNDFEDEKAGETYENDYAENNEDYNSEGDVENYTAEFEPEVEDAFDDAVDDSFDMA